ncbi:MAG: tetratricopeptide repeat protein [Candidatus Heimdallarchaeota archaeon]|nr:tetratricopeptide repeat protein [Candidatus Heimdallarchaeota archaeon]
MSRHGDSSNNKLLLIENLFKEKKFEEGEKLLLSVDEIELETNEKIQYLFLKSSSLLRKSDFKELLTLSRIMKELCFEKGSNEQKIKSVNISATALYRLGKFEEGIKQMEDLKELDLFKSYKKNTVIASYYFTLGSIYWAYGKFDLALENIYFSMQIWKKVGKLVDIAKAMNNMGLIYASSGNLKKALIFFKKSLRIKKRLKQKDSIANTFNNIGHVYLNMGNIDKALRYLQKSLAIAKEMGDQYGIAKSNNILGNIYYEKGELDKALYYFQKCLTTFQESETKPEIVYLLNDIGMVFFHKGNLIDASNYFEQSLIISKKMGNEQDIATILENIGLVQRISGNLSLALSNFEESLHYRRKIGNQSEIANSMENIGYNMSLMEKYSEAIRYFDDCLELRKKVDNQLHTALTLFNMISFYYNYMENNDLEKSTKLIVKEKLEDYFEQLKKINIKHGNKQINTQYQLASCLKIIYNNQRNYYDQTKKMLSLVMNDKSNSYQYRILASINLCYLYFYEYTEKGQKRYLNKIKMVIDEAIEFAGKKQITNTILLFQVLKAKLAIFEHQLETAKDSLETIKKQAQKLGYKLIESQCNKEIERINERKALDFILIEHQEEKEKLVFNLEIFHFLKDLAINIQQSVIREKSDNIMKSI